MSHTKEPWKSEFDADNPEGSQWAIKDRIGFFIADCHDNAGRGGRVYGEVNARRIVACVNALEGVPTEQLELGGNAENVFHVNAQLRQQRDDLLSALKLCASVCAGEAMSKSELIRALEYARSAIAKAEAE